MPETPVVPPDDQEKLSAVNRRRFLVAAASAAGMTAIGAMTARLAAEQPTAPPDPTRVPGALARPYGERSPFEHASRQTRRQVSLTPLQALHGIMTPSALHFERHHNGVPLIDLSRHRLLVHGLVERPLVFTVEELERFPTVSRFAFIECSGNTGSEWHGALGRTVQETHGLNAASEWTGVPLRALLHEVGLKR